MVSSTRGHAFRPRTGQPVSRRLGFVLVCSILSLAITPDSGLAQSRQDTLGVLVNALVAVRAQVARNTPSGVAAIDTLQFQPRTLAKEIAQRLNAPRTHLSALQRCQAGELECTAIESEPVAILWPAANGAVPAVTIMLDAASVRIVAHHLRGGGGPDANKFEHAVVIVRLNRRDERWSVVAVETIGSSRSPSQQ